MIEPEPYNFRPLSKRLCTFDTETDPFKIGRVVKPFTCGFHIVDSGEYWDFWGDDCIEQFFEFLDANFSEQELLIMCHNWGNFDAYFCTDQFDSGSSPFIINGRLVRTILHGQEFRDSYANIPVALGNMGAGVKLDIDYSKLERDVRDLHRDEILAYQKQDCIGLGVYVKNWFDMFGDKLTMASAALPMLRSFHGFETVPEYIDDQLRPFYFGGRCECFETGVLKDDWKIYDVHSMYPAVMASEQHPISGHPISSYVIGPRTFFAKIDATSDGCLPVRKPDGGLHFPHGRDSYFASIHEINAGLETGTLVIHSVEYAIDFEVSSTFQAFVDHFYSLRLKAAAAGDDILKLFYKLVLNSSYGKFAQDPRKYETYLFDPDEMPTPLLCPSCAVNIKGFQGRITSLCATCDSGLTSPFGWNIDCVRDGKAVWCKPQTRINKHGSISNRGFFNVATAASITAAARAKLWRGLCGADRPIYCDTDSIICRSFQGELHDNRLGTWGREAVGDTACIGGKKLYAIFNDGEEIKKASKGVKLTAQEIARVCAGEVVTYASPVPKFKLDGRSEWIVRNIKRTGTNG